MRYLKYFLFGVIFGIIGGITARCADAAPYASMDEAAVAALTRAGSCSTAPMPGSMARECGGYIYPVPGGYAFTTPVTSNNVTSIDLSAVYVTRKDWVADYHTHPCVGVKEISEVFSQQDVLSDKGLHIVGYMLSLCDGVVHRWAPGDPEDDFEVDYHSGRTIYLATGHVVGFVLP